MTFACQTCGETARNVAAARKHAKQGYKTQREAFAAGELHSLHLVESPRTQVDLLDALGHPWEADRAYCERVQVERHAHGAHDSRPQPADCPTCAA